MSVDFATDEIAWDAYESEYEEIIRLIESLLLTAKGLVDEHNNSGSLVCSLA